MTTQQRRYSDSILKQTQIAIEYLTVGILEVRFKTNYPGVRIPASIRRQRKDEYTLLFPGPDVAPTTRDLHVGGDGISGVLAFKAGQFRCIIPWESITAMGGQGVSGVSYPEYTSANWDDPVPFVAAESTPDSTDGIDLETVE